MTTILNKILGKIVDIFVKDPSDIQPVIITPKEELQQIDAEIKAYYNIWNNTNDKALIDSCIYHIEALKRQRSKVHNELLQLAQQKKSS